MYQVQKYSKNRQVIHDLLHRARRFHCPVSTTWEMDCTEAMNQLRLLRRQNVPASFSAFLVKVTAQLLQEHPHLNSHLFTSWTGKKTIVRFDDINCNVVVLRESQGEKILMPLVIHKANTLSVSEIENIIDHHKHAELETLPQFQSFEKVKKMPFWLLRFISYKTRSDPDFYIRYYGTYGLSTLYSFKASSATGGSTYANTCIAFLPFNVGTRKVEGETRRILRICLVLDHYILDGAQISQAGYDFQRLIENPRRVKELLATSTGDQAP